MNWYKLAQSTPLDYVIGRLAGYADGIGQVTHIISEAEHAVKKPLPPDADQRTKIMYSLAQRAAAIRSLAELKQVAVEAKALLLNKSAAKVPFADTVQVAVAADDRLVLLVGKQRYEYAMDGKSIAASIERIKRSPNKMDSGKRISAILHNIEQFRVSPPTNPPAKKPNQMNLFPEEGQ